MRNIILIFMIILVVGSCKLETRKKNSTKSEVSESVNKFYIDSASSEQAGRIRYLVRNRADIIGDIYCLRAPGFNRVHFVACKVNYKKKLGVIILAMSGRRHSPGLTMSLNNYSYEVTGMPLGIDTKARISMSDEGALELTEYVQKH